MAWMPGVTVRDVGAGQGKFTNGKMRSYTGIVLHCNDADSDDLFDWITSDHDMSCHFQVGPDGEIFQYISTEFSSWCQANGNNDYLSIESSGKAGALLNKAELTSVTRIVAWASATHSIPLQAANAPGQRGLGWHGMGAAQGWGHAVCPGVRRGQIPAILAGAKGNAGPVVKFNPGPDRLMPGQGLHAGKSISSPNGKYHLTMQTDGNLVLSRGHLAIWSTHTAHAGYTDVKFQTDSNIVLTGAGAKAKGLGLNGKGGAILQLQDDGNLVMKSNRNKAIWSTRTNGK